MAFSLSNAVSGGNGFGGMAQSGSGTKVIDAPELQEIQTDQLGFASINGDAQLQLLSSPWPADALPPPTSSLLSVASSKGLLAAAGPESVVIVSAESVRDGFRAAPVDVKGKVRAFKPQITIPQSRPTQVAFSSDESVLVVSAEGGGLEAFQVDGIRNGRTTPALQISTNGINLRALVPNPVVESAELFALVTSNGDLLLADLKAGQLRSGTNGNVLRAGVSCLSWSNKGKQLVAGLADGTATQMKPDGTVVAEIPRSTSVPSDCHVSSISWLENDSFFVIYTPNNTTDGIQPSEYYIINREPKTSNYTFHKLPEIIPAFGVERIPNFHFIARLRNFPPHIKDLLVLTATAGTDVGLVSKAEKPLSGEDENPGQFTFTMIADDRRRAQLPLTNESMDTTPIGMVVDLSSTEKVPNPIPSDVELLETDGPVPNLLVLNSEGILVSFWLIYTDSVREKTLFSGFSGLNNTVETPDNNQGLSEASPAPAQSPFAPPTSTFAQTALGSLTSSNKPAENSPAPGSMSSAFGASSANTFGQSSTIGGAKSSWATTGFGGDTAKQTPASGFGQPAFGSATPFGSNNSPVFGTSSALGNQSTPFGQPAVPSNAAFGKPSAFGAPSGAFGGATSASPFGAFSGASGSSGFASFSNNKGFAGFGGTNNQQSQSPFGTTTGKSIFGQASTDSPFGSTSEKPQTAFGAVSGKSIFGQPTTDNTFGIQKDKPSVFGAVAPAAKASPLASGGAFKLDSSFKGDGSAKDDLPKPTSGSGFGFGSSFANILNEPESALSPTHDKEAEMGEGDETDTTEPAQNNRNVFSGFTANSAKDTPQTLITPPSTLTQSKATTTPSISTLFGTSDQESTTPLPQTTTPAWTFGQVASTTPKETPVNAPLFGTIPQSSQTPAIVQKSEPMPLFGNLPKIADSGSTSKEQAPKIKEEPASDEESVDFSKIPEAPLPPEPTSKPHYTPGDTSGSSNESSKSGPDTTSRSQDFFPANKSAGDEAQQSSIPSDDEEDLSSDFGGSAEDGTEDVSPIEEASDDQAEQIQTSPESSFKSSGRSPQTSPTGGLFTKVSNNGSQKPARPLFGEVGAGPIFAPPKPHESPRSPSPVRHPISNNNLRAESARSVSVPAYPRSAIDKRKTEYAQSTLASQAARAKEEAEKEKEQQKDLARSRTQTQEQLPGTLDDEEEERLQQELNEPIQPLPNLDEFITHQPDVPQSNIKSGIPAQIERLYRDINSMVYTLGINARSLSAFIRYQDEQAINHNWQQIFSSETPLEEMQHGLVLGNIPSLYEGNVEIEAALEEAKVNDLSRKLGDCQILLGRDLFELRTKLTSLRKTLHIKKSHDNTLAMPLSAEQASIQHDLRKAAALVQAKLAKVEDELSILRAKLAELGPLEADGQRQGVLGRTTSQKKPTVEAVTNTISKMTAMAEKKSADIDVLEAQLKKVDLSSNTSTNGSRLSTIESPGTPQRNRRSTVGLTPRSSSNSVYHTPDSKFSGTPSSPSAKKSTMNGGTVVVSVEDRERWQAKARRKREVASILKCVLENRKQPALS